jgi:hypothetical protein
MHTGDGEHAARREHADRFVEEVVLASGRFEGMPQQYHPERLVHERQGFQAAGAHVASQGPSRHAERYPVAQEGNRRRLTLGRRREVQAVLAGAPREQGREHARLIGQELADLRRRIDVGGELDHALRV